MYTNYDSDIKTDTDWSKISTYHLLSVVADKTGTAKTPYMNLLTEKFKTTPYYHVRLGRKPNDKDFIKFMEDYTYYKLTQK